MRTTPPAARPATLGTVRTLENVRARMRAIDPFRADLLLAAAFVVAGVIELSLIDADGGDRGLTTVAGAVTLSSLAFRRRDALVAAALFSVPALLQAFLDGYLTTNSTSPFVAVMLLLYSIGRYAPAERFRAATALLTTSTTITLLVESGLDPAEIFWAVFLFGLPLLAGRALRSRALLQAELRDKAERAERDRDDRGRAAVEEERMRIAGELQALVANGLSAMVVQAETVPRAFAAADPAGAGAALASIEATGRDALTEMRRLLGVLRREDDGAELAPQPGLPRVLALAERTRQCGLPVELRIEGHETRNGRLPPGIDLTAYRVIEDALEAAAEQGASAVELLIRYTPEELQLQVLDDREGGASDRLAGLRDRVGLYGGHLSAGRLDEGGFRLRARLPLEVVS
jgi:signal transduction histidine kinase